MSILAATGRTPTATDYATGGRGIRFGLDNPTSEFRRAGLDRRESGEGFLLTSRGHGRRRGPGAAGRPHHAHDAARDERRRGNDSAPSCGPPSRDESHMIGSAPSSAREWRSARVVGVAFPWQPLRSVFRPKRCLLGEVWFVACGVLRRGTVGRALAGQFEKSACWSILGLIGRLSAAD
ncbi:unnamed protein product [Diplocarpon coronariae]